MQQSQAPNTDPLPSISVAPTSCTRSTRKQARWTPYGSRSAPPITRQDSFPLKSTPRYTLPLSPELTPASGPSTGPKSHPTSVEEIPEDTACGEKHDASHERSQQNVAKSKNEKKYEYTDDFIDVMLGILSLIYCSPLLIAGGRTFVIPQNFASQPPPIPHDRASTTAIGHHKPNHMRWFIERLLERTRPPRAVCQLAVAYLLSASDAVQAELRTAAEIRLRRAATHHHPPLALPVPILGSGPTLPGMASAPLTPEAQLPPPYSAEPVSAFSTPIGMPPLHLLSLPHPAPVSPLIDPRRVMLAAMVLAHKFHLDKTWTNKAWAKVSGLEPREVGRCERTVAIALGHRLWAGRV